MLRRPLRNALLAVTALVGLVTLAGCTDDPDPEPTPEPVVELLSPSARLARASIALRGTRPTRAELEAVDADPARLEEIVRGYVETPAFGRTMRDLHSQSLQLRIDWLFYPAGFLPSDELAAEDTVTINESVMEAPLRLIEGVILEGRPYTEIVTAPYTVTNRVAATVWDLPFDEAGPSWQKTAYEDGRGNAGILTDSWLHVRWQSTPSNANRGRANALSRSLLCYDFLSRDVTLDTDIDTSDPNVVQAAVVENEACASCHQALDPLASFFRDMFPIIVPSDELEYPVTPMFYPGVFEDLLEIDMRPPAYFGEAGSSLEDLGALIAADPRFSACAARRFYAYFHQVPLDAAPFDRVLELDEAFVASNYDARELALNIVLADDFAASHVDDDAAAASLDGLRKMRPDELAGLVEDKTGFVWTTELGPYTEGLIDRVDLARDSFLGYRVVGGGTDGAFVLFETRTETAASSLFLRAFAEEAAAYTVETELVLPPEERRLLTELDEEEPSDSALRSQMAHLLAELHARLVEPDDEAVTRLLTLYRASLDEHGEPARAMETVLAAMLQDVSVAYY